MTIPSKTCVVVRPPSRDACGAVAPLRVRWSDGDVSSACQDCALYLQQLAQSNSTVVKVERA
jgi:hypothetical protein